VTESLHPPSLTGELRQQWRIAWPLFIAQTAQMGTGVVDTVMAARFDPTDLAAIAIGYNIWLPLFLLVLGVLFATSTIVAQDFGAGRIDKIRAQLPQSLWLAIILGLIVSPICYFSNPILDLLNLVESTQVKAHDYVKMVALGLPAVGVFHALRYHTQGLGITKPFAAASVIGFIANIPLNWGFIYGQWGLPSLGAEGCGIATAISMWLSLLLIAFYVLRSNAVARFLPPIRYQPPSWSAIKDILSLGVPIGLTFFLEVGVFSFIALLVATLGDTAMGAHQIAFNVWDMFYIPMLAVGTAMSTRIGHAIGAGRPDAVRLALWVGASISAAIGLCTMLVLFTVPELIISMYTDDANIHALATRLIKLAAFFILIDAIQIVGSFTLRAFKETRFPFLMMVVSYWLIALPLGYWLGIVEATNPQDGAAGFWYATIAGIAMCAFLIVLRVWRVLHMPLPTKRIFTQQPPDTPPKTALD